MTQFNDLQKTISAAYEGKESHESEKVSRAIRQTIELLDSGQIRVASPNDGTWTTHQWIKQAILLFFKISRSQVISSGPFSFYDKIPLKKWTGSEGVRVVPQALARQGSFVGQGCILMPSFVNIGAYVGSGTMVDTWATVGSCAQIGENVHLSGGVGIGGVLEPLQNNPVIIENHAFIGSRVIVVEGVHIEEGAVIGAGVTLTASTKIFDATQSEAVTYTGRVPKNSVVIPGSYSKEFKGGFFNVPCALIIGKRSAQTDKKTSLNQVLREFEVSV